MATALIAICLVASALTYGFIERPFLARKARIRGSTGLRWLPDAVLVSAAGLL